MRPFLIFIAILPTLLACQKERGYRPGQPETPQFAAEAPQCKSLGQKVIYDEDDRRDWWQVQGMIKNYWAASTVALIRKNKLKKSKKSGYFLEEPSYGDQMRLCRGVPFFNQPQVLFALAF